MVFVYVEFQRASEVTMRKLLLALSCMILVALSACAPGQRPFADPADTARHAQIVSALGEYAETVHASAVGGRVYLDGTLPNFNDLQEVLNRVGSVPGVRDIVYNEVILTEIGSNGDNNSDWE